uniref:HPP transmembrane region domain-containing protein n=1 Tax=Hanusia phi TaxID=3032 RepID=A0A7S0DY98_9CRYP|mmetsp:Transcript_12207/g.28150  ORF Transcript_12207/g.28150 Transcript_12207/m.28150 type:complete len:605 (+) Transcript_12207:32-1846(+)
MTDFSHLPMSSNGGQAHMESGAHQEDRSGNGEKKLCISQESGSWSAENAAVNRKNDSQPPETQDEEALCNLHEQDPVQCLLHDVCTTLGFVYADLWLRLPEDRAVTSEHESAGNDTPDVTNHAEQDGLGSAAEAFDMGMRSNPHSSVFDSKKRSLSNLYGRNGSKSHFPSVVSFGLVSEESHGVEARKHAELAKKLADKLRWSGQSYLHELILEIALDSQSCDEDVRSRIQAMEEVALDDVCSYDEGSGIAGMAWKLQKPFWYDLTGLETIGEEDAVFDARLSLANGIFDFCVAVPISHPHWNQVIGIMTFYHLDRRQSTDIRQHQGFAQMSKSVKVTEILAQASCAVYWAYHLRNSNLAWHQLLEQTKQTQVAYEVSTTGQETEASAPPKALGKRFRHFWRKYLRKFKGQNATPPGPHTWQYSLWSFVGTYLSLFILTSVSNWMKYNTSFGSYFKQDADGNLTIHEGYIFLLINSMGAVCAMLTAAPVSPLVQPRNVLCGHVIAAIISICLDYLCNPKYLNVIPQWVVAPLAPALAIGLQAKLGVIHPPSCSASVIYTMGLPYVKNVGWLFLACPVITDCVILVCFAVLFNNLSKDRRYPLYW